MQKAIAIFLFVLSAGLLAAFATLEWAAAQAARSAEVHELLGETVLLAPPATPFRSMMMTATFLIVITFGVGLIDVCCCLYRKGFTTLIGAGVAWGLMRLASESFAPGSLGVTNLRQFLFLQTLQDLVISIAGCAALSFGIAVILDSVVQLSRSARHSSQASR